MSCFLSRAARLVLTAGALGTAPLAGAAAPEVQLIGAIHVAPGQVQLEAMKVEMALLADRATYQLPLAVQLKSDCLELHGQVPDEARLQAAASRSLGSRAICLVHDAIHVFDSPAPAGPLTGAALRKAASEILAQHFGRRAENFDVAVREGQISLRGQVGSVEEKLNASRCLRGLPGCTSIVNWPERPADQSRRPHPHPGEQRWPIRHPRNLLVPGGGHFGRSGHGRGGRPGKAAEHPSGSDLPAAACSNADAAVRIAGGSMHQPDPRNAPPKRDHAAGLPTSRRCLLPPCPPRRPQLPTCLSRAGGSVLHLFGLLGGDAAFVIVPPSPPPVVLAASDPALSPDREGASALRWLSPLLCSTRGSLGARPCPTRLPSRRLLQLRSSF